MNTAVKHEFASLSPEKKKILELVLRQRELRERAIKPRESNPSGADGRPMAGAQQRLWFIDQLEGGTAAYHTPLALRLAGDVDVDSLSRALNTIVMRHETLRTVIVRHEGEPVQKVAPYGIFPIQVLDLRGFSGDDLQMQVNRHSRDELNAPFDLSVGPLIRGRLLRIDDAEYLLYITMHHIISDGWSLTVMLREVIALYAAYQEGHADPLPPLPIQYGDYARWQQEWLAGPVVRGQLEYWQSHLQGAPELLELPTDRPRPSVQSYRGSNARVLLGLEISSDLKAFARRHQLTMAMMLHFAWSVLLFRLSGQEDIVVGVPVANRSHRELENLIGFFVNTLAVRLRFQGDPKIADLLRTTRETMLKAYANQDVPFDTVVEALRPQRKLSHNPLVQVMFNWHTAPTAAMQSGNLRVSMEQVALTAAQFDLSMSLQETEFGIEGVLNYAADLFDAATIENWLQCFQLLIREMVAKPEATASQLNLVNEPRRWQVVESFNSKLDARKLDLTIPMLFEEQVVRTPNRTAVLYEERALTFAELNTKSNQLARHLRRGAVGPDDTVGLCVERSVDMLVGVLGILKAGAAYVPLDPSYPAERVAHMLEDARPRVLITQSSLLGSLPALPMEVVTIDGDWSTAAVEDDENLSQSTVGLRTDHLAYVIYTSGSTGRPKGVMIEHRSVVNLFYGLEHIYRESECGSRVALNASLNFDASLQQILQLLAGRTVVVVPHLTRQDPAAMLDFLAHSKVEAIDCTPSQVKAWIAAGMPARTDLRLKLILIGGEAISPELWCALASSSSTQSFNVYGPTECTVDATAARIGASTLLPDIGRSMHNRRIYILDRHRQVLPPGVTGEIYIGGPGVARGYLHRPDLTAERFVGDPFSTTPQGRMYKTGDLARWHHDGRIEYLGRNDDQVKIRGYRIELGEVEAQLALCGLVREAAVVAREDVPGDKRLVGYVTAVDPLAPPSPALLRSHLQKTLPDHMIPTAFVTLARMPCTSSGKLDRKALPAPELGAYASRSYEAPAGEVEGLLAAIWGQLLGLERVGRQDNFFELGGHSLLIMKMMERLRRFGLETQVRLVFENPTLAGLASKLVNAREESNEVPANRIPSGCKNLTAEMLPLVELTADELTYVVQRVPGGGANIEDIYPLVPLQEGILFHHLMDGGDTYLLATVLSVSSRQRLNQLISGLQAVIDRHGVLRTSVLWGGKLLKPVQVVHRTAIVPVLEFAFEAERDPLEQIRERVKPANQRIDLTMAPLMRLLVAADPLRDGYWYAVLQMHHITTDHVTSEVLMSEVVAHMDGQPLPPVTFLPYRNHVARAIEYAKRNDAQAYFKSMLSDIDEPTAPFGFMDVHGDGTQIDQTQIVIDQALVRMVRMQARRLGVSAATLFHAAWGLVVAVASGREDIVFGTVLLGRLQAGATTPQILGLFINTLPLRLRLRGETVRGLVEQTQRRLVELLNHEQASLAEAQRCSGIVGNAPLFSALFNYRHSTATGDSDWSSASGVETLIAQERTNYPITVSIDDHGDEITATVQTDQRIAPTRVAEYLRSALISFVHALEVDSETPVHALSILSSQERVQLLEVLRGERAHRTAGVLVHHLFEQQAQLTPHSAAVVYGGKSLTYAELNTSANRLARHLQSKVIGPGDIVAVCTERRSEMIVGLLAVLKAGAAYLPLDPAYPVERLRHMLEDSQPRVVLTVPRLGSLFSTTSADTILLSEVMEGTMGGDGADDCLSRVDSLDESAVYVIYTSGSTGRPKGTVMSHRAMVNLIEWHRGELSAADGVRVLQFAALSFDVAFQEIFSTLCTGGTLVLVDEEKRRDVGALIELLREERVARLFIPPVLLQTLAEWSVAGKYDLTGLKDIVTAGEQLRVSPEIAEFVKRQRACRLHNHYGPTETHVVTALTLDGSPAEWPQLPTIGVPIANTNIYILDERRQLAALGVVGEIYIGGVNVARGYLNRPELTAERFVADPFSSDPRARVYKTGDLGRWRTDGTIEYLGRNDDQVKIRGFRIELGEVECQLAKHEKVKEAVVVARTQDAGQRRLVAYYTLRQAGDIGSDELRVYMRAMLPEHMVPSAFVEMETLPLTPSGKVNRRALPTDEDNFVSNTYEPPVGDAESRLEQIWCEVLGTRRVGRDEDFFAIGGHSLLALKALFRINQAFGTSLRINDLYRNPTICKLGRTIRGESTADEWVDLSREAVLDDDIKSVPATVHSGTGAVFLTGATGFVGRFLLAQLLRETQTRIYCLVRADSAAEASAKLWESLRKWNVVDERVSDRVVAVPGDLRFSRLRIEEPTYRLLCDQTDTIYHSATSMNHLETYTMAKPANVEAAKELLKIATSSRPKLVNYISTLGVFGAKATDAPRRVSENSDISNEKYRQSQGYLASKWVAEKIFMLAQQRGIACNILRLGLVWADTELGRFDELQHVYRVLKTSLLSGYGIKQYRYSMPPTPVDYTARAITYLGRRHQQGGGIFHISSSTQAADGVFERCNDIAGLSLKLLPYYDWMIKVREFHQQGWSLPIVPLLEAFFGMSEPEFRRYNDDLVSAANIHFECLRTHRELENAGIEAPVLDNNLLALCLRDMINRDPDLRGLATQKILDTGT